METKITDIDVRLIAFFKRSFIPVARVSIFIVFFWFGLIKLLGLSPASTLAKALIGWLMTLVYKRNTDGGLLTFQLP